MRGLVDERDLLRRRAWGLPEVLWLPVEILAELDMANPWRKTPLEYETNFVVRRRSVLEPATLTEVLSSR
jgi:hypothetical protein